MQWHTEGTDIGGIEEAKYSCDSELVYAVFLDGSIGVFDATAGLQLRCRITKPSAVLSDEMIQMMMSPGTSADTPNARRSFFLLCSAAVEQECLWVYSIIIICVLGVDLTVCRYLL